jgi:hypothetical protein
VERGINKRSRLSKTARSDQITQGTGLPKQIWEKKKKESSSKHSLYLFALPKLETFSGIAQPGGNFDLARDLCSGLLQPTLLLGQKIPPARLRIVSSRARGVLERAELVPTLDLEDDVLVDGNEREDVKDEKLELEPVGLHGLDNLCRLGSRIDGGNLLASDMVRHLWRKGSDRIEEVGRVKVVGNVGSAELERTGIGWVTFLGHRFGDLAVLDDSPFARFKGDDADRLVRPRLCDDLCTAVCASGDAVAQEGGVGWTDEAVVDAVRVEVLDTPSLEVREDGGRCRVVERSAEGGVDASVPIGRDGQFGRRGKQEFAVVGQTRKRAWQIRESGGA